MENRIKELRMQLGLTQKEVAEKAQIDLRVYRRLEIGEVDIMMARLKNIMAIASVLGVSIDELVKKN